MAQPDMTDEERAEIIEALRIRRVEMHGVPYTGVVFHTAYVWKTSRYFALILDVVQGVAINVKGYCPAATQKEADTIMQNYMAINKPINSN